MRRRPRWVWVTLFIFVALLLFALATTWNVVLVNDYRKMSELAGRLTPPVQAPWLTTIFGTLGFMAVISATVIFFIKTLKEMRLNQQKSEFLARVTHELKTPLSTIELTSSQLRDTNRSAEQVQELWQLHDQELKRLKKDVQSLLNAARWEEGLVKPQVESIDLRDWIHRSQQRWKSLLGSDATLEVKVPDRALRTQLDPSLFELITNNIIINAKKFAKATPQLTVDTSISRNRWKISFHDHGWGFDPSYAKKIFERFERVGTKAPYSIPGTGLGLHIASQASRAMKVKLSAHSAGPGKGACFEIQGKLSHV